MPDHDARQLVAWRKQRPQPPKSSNAQSGYRGFLRIERETLTCLNPAEPASRPAVVLSTPRCRVPYNTLPRNHHRPYGRRNVRTHVIVRKALTDRETAALSCVTDHCNGTAARVFDRRAGRLQARLERSGSASSDKRGISSADRRFESLTARSRTKWNTMH